MATARRVSRTTSSATRNTWCIGGAGRSYDRDLYDYLQLEQTKAALSQYNYYFQDESGNCVRGSTPCIPWDPKYLNGVENLQSLVVSEHGGQGSRRDQQQSQGAVFRSVQPRHAQQDRRLEHERDRAHVSTTRMASCSRSATVIPTAHFWINGSQPWGNGVPGFGRFIIGNNGIENKTTQLLLSAEKPYTKESGWGATFAYTYTDAKQNRDINEHYSFDHATIHDYPFITSNAVAKHRFVATGSIDGPWDIVYSGKLTLATPIPIQRIPVPAGAIRTRCAEQPDRAPSTPPGARRSCSAARSSAIARSI